MKKRMIMLMAVTGAAVCAANDTIQEGYRVWTQTNVTYDVTSAKTPDALPASITDSILFSFDARNRTNWWVKNGKVVEITNDVTRAEYKDRFLTADMSNTADPKLNAIAVDEWITGTITGYTGNVWKNIGSIVAVCRSKTAQGTLLCGPCFDRGNAYKWDSDGNNLRQNGPWLPLFKYNAPGTYKYGSCWTGLQKDAPDKSRWTGRWEVKVANPRDASDSNYAYGIGNGTLSCDFSMTRGDIAYAELMIFDRALTDEETKQVVIFLEKKWLPQRLYAGKDGKASFEWLQLGDTQQWAPGNDDVQTATFNVADGEELRLGRLNGGRHAGDVKPQIVKQGAGAMNVTEAENFGGAIVVREGALTFRAKKAVPTAAQLPANMTLRLDPSDVSSLTVAEGKVTQWNNISDYAATINWQTPLVQSDADRQPTFIADALGTGLNVLDFGRYSATMDNTNGKYLEFAKARPYQTLIAVVDTRVNAAATS